jgi:hypothetical protein
LGCEAVGGGFGRIFLHNPKVGGSIPPVAIKTISHLISTYYSECEKVERAVATTVFRAFLQSTTDCPERGSLETTEVMRQPDRMVSSWGFENY